MIRTTSGKTDREGLPQAGVRRAVRDKMRLLVAVDKAARSLFLSGMEERIGKLVPEVVIPDEPGDLSEETLREIAPDIVLTHWASPAALHKWLLDPHCPVKYVCHLMGTVRFIVPRAFIERGGLVSNWGSIAAPAVAEHALLLALMALRNAGRWQGVIESPDNVFTPKYLDTRSLFGRRVGIHGFGSVARELVALLRPFGVTVSAYTEGVAGHEYTQLGAVRSASLRDLFHGSDILFECEGLTPGNEGIVDAALLACLPDGAVFVNVGRGQLVNEADLLCETLSGRIRVALDVVCKEPLTAHNPLYSVNDAVLSPHIAGPTADQYSRIGELALANIERFLTGEEPASRVTLEIYDRAT